MERKALIEKIFDKLDTNHEGFLKLDDLEKALLNVNETNRLVIMKYIKKYQSFSKVNLISKANFIDLLMLKNKAPIVHVKLSEILDDNFQVKSGETFSERLKKRLNLPKYRKNYSDISENFEKPAEGNDVLYESHEKTKPKSSKQRNLEELISIRRCHLLYS